MTNESKLKKLINNLKEEAYKLQLEAFKETIEASVIANKYLQAINDIDSICKDRNRY